MSSSTDIRYGRRGGRFTDHGPVQPSAAPKCRICARPMLLGQNDAHQVCLENPTTPAPEPIARASDPRTSHEAALAAMPTAAIMRDRVLATLRAHPEGLCDFRLADLLEAKQTSAGKRRGELVETGHVIDTGRACHETGHGHTTASKIWSAA